MPMRILYFLFPWLLKKSIVRRYRKYLKRQEEKEERKDIRRWIKSEF